MFTTKNKLFKKNVNRSNNKLNSIQSQNYIQIIKENERNRKKKIDWKLIEYKNNLQKNKKKYLKNQILNKTSINEIKFKNNNVNNILVKRKNVKDFKLKNFIYNNKNDLIKYFNNNYKQSINNVINYIDSKYNYKTDNKINKNLNKKITNKLKLYLEYVIKINKRFNLNNYEIKFPNVAYSNKNSKKFIELCKYDDENNKDMMKNMLKENKFLVLDYDYFGLTALHWACKRGNLEIVKLLIYYCSPLNSLDKLERSPYFYAIVNKDIEIVKILLAHKIDTRITNINQELFNKYKHKTKNYFRYIRIFNNLKNIYKISKKNKREIFWKEEMKLLNISYYY